MGPPTLYQQYIRQLLGRAIRETGQALDRLGIKVISLATTKHDYYDDPVIYEDYLSRHRQLFPMLISGRPIIHYQIGYIAPCATIIGSVHIGQHSSIWYGSVLRADTCENTESLVSTYNIEIDNNNHDNSNNNNNNNISSNSYSTHDSSIETTTTTTSNTNNNNNPTKTITNHTNQYHHKNIKSIQPWELSKTRYQDQLDHHGGGIFIGNSTNVQDSCIITAYDNHCIIGDHVTIGHSAQLHSCTIHDYCLIGMGSIINPGVIVETESFIAAGTVIPPNTIVPKHTLWMGNPGKMIRTLTNEQIQKLHYQSSEYVHVAHMHQHIMELGGNLDPTTGTCVHMIPENDNDDDDEEDEEDEVYDGIQSNDTIQNDTMDIHQSQQQMSLHDSSLEQANNSNRMNGDEMKTEPIIQQQSIYPKVNDTSPFIQIEEETNNNSSNTANQKISSASGSSQS